MDEPTVAILAGGESRRMGADKALLEYEGRRLLEHVAAAAQSFGPILVVGRRDAEAFDLPEATFLPDRHPDQGPLGGLQTALAHADGPILLVGCDMPLLDRPTLDWLVDAYNDSGAAGLVGQTDDGLQPLLGLYAPDLAPLVDELLADGIRSLHRLVVEGDIESRPLPDALAGRLINVNTPADFARLRRQ